MSLPAILTATSEVVDLAAELSAYPSIAVDLEADSLHNYQEKVCLLQFTSPDRTVLVDPLAGLDLAALRPLFANPQQRKIFHAADYDIRCLARDFDVSIRGLFDTMISCQFLGEERFGLGDVLKKYFGVELDKRYQRADWSKRPLSREMISYAAEDTRYLDNLAQILEEKLRAKGRLEWVMEECALLEKVRFNQHEGPAFLRFKGAGTLGPRQLAALEELLLWRDAEARRRDCPHYKVLGNKPLLELARLLPEGRQQLDGIEGFPPSLASRFAPAILNLTRKVLALPEERLPSYPRVARKERDAVIELRLGRLKAWRITIAKQLELDTGVLINNVLLEELAARNPRDHDELEALGLLKTWQLQVLADGILKALRGG